MIGEHETLYDQVDAELAHDHIAEPNHPPRRELDRENLPGDFKIEPTAEDAAAVQRLVAAHSKLRPGFKDKPL